MRPSLIAPTVLTLLMVLVTMVSAQDDDVISVDSSIVLVNATITDRSGKAVTGLERRMFRILEDGVEQSIALFEAKETPFAAVILLDTSGSMEDRVVLARAAAIQFLQGMRYTDSAAVYNFDSKVTMVQDFSNSGDIRERMYELKSSGMTVLNDAVYKAAELLSKREEKRRAIVVLSDGADTQSRKSSDSALKAALAAGCTIYTVDMSAIGDMSVSRRQNQGVLKMFAERTGGRFVAAPGGMALREAFKQAVAELGVQYTLAYSPQNVKKDGKWRSIELRVAQPGLTIRARKGYHAAKAK